jgi:hypothetical protein
MRAIAATVAGQVAPAFPCGPWSTSLKAHWLTIATVDPSRLKRGRWWGLAQFYVFFVINLDTPRVRIAALIGPGVAT